MVKKTISLNFLLYVLFLNVTQAQNTFSIRINQVYPPQSAAVHVNTYSLSSQLDAAERNLRTEFSSGSRANANYTMELTRPTGRETKAIQNIFWVRSIDGKIDRYKDISAIPKMDASYPKATKIEIFAINNDGSRKNDSRNSVTEFNHYYKLFIDGIEQTIGTGADKQSYFRPRDKCEEAAKKYFNEKKPEDNSALCEVKIFDSTNKIVSVISNKEQHDIFLSKKEKEKEAQEDNTPQTETETEGTQTTCETVVMFYKNRLHAVRSSPEKIKNDIKDEAFTAIMRCISVEEGYSKTNISEILNLCVEAVKYLPQDNKKSPKKDELMEKIELILSTMEKNEDEKPTNFDRKRLNTTQTKQIEQIINVLIEINKKL